MNIQSVMNNPANGSVVALRQNASDSTSTVATQDTSAGQAPTITQQAVQPNKEVQPSKNQLEDAVKAVNDFVKTVNNSLQFSVDSDTGKTVVKVIDNATKEVVKQIPSEEMMAIAKALDSIKGLLVHQKA